jgi:hypothetical protein
MRLQSDTPNNHRPRLGVLQLMGLLLDGISGLAPKSQVNLPEATFCSSALCRSGASDGGVPGEGILELG